jgi:hypothetical protein
VYSYEVYRNDQRGTLVAQPGDNFFSTATVTGPNTTIIRVLGAQNDVKASSGAPCR